MSGLRYFGGAVAFGFAAIWIMASLVAAVVCLLSAIAGYGAVLVADLIRAELVNRRRSGHVSTSAAVAPLRPTPEAGDLPLWADALNSDLGHVYEPTAATSALSAEAAYGWPLTDDTVVTREPLH